MIQERRHRGGLAHRVRYLNIFSRKWSPFEARVSTIPWWRLLGEELWQGVRAPSDWFPNVSAVPQEYEIASGSQYTVRIYHSFFPCQ